MRGEEKLPIIIPLLSDKEGASIDDLDDHIRFASALQGWRGRSQ